MSKDPWNPYDKELWEPLYEGYLTWASYNGHSAVSYREFIRKCREDIKKK